MRKVNTPIVLVLDNIRSLYNVGSFFRTADGFGVAKIWLCGITGTPEQHGVQKVALGAELSVPWEYAAKTWRVVERLRSEGFAVVGLESAPGTRSLVGYQTAGPTALVVGNEIRGLTPALQKRLDAVLEIPMLGVKESFNVATAGAIALYELRRQSLPK